MSGGGSALEAEMALGDELGRPGPCPVTGGDTCFCALAEDRTGLGAAGISLDDLEQLPASDAPTAFEIELSDQTASSGQVRFSLDELSVLMPAGAVEGALTFGLGGRVESGQVILDVKDSGITDFVATFVADANANGVGELYQITLVHDDIDAVVLRIAPSDLAFAQEPASKSSEDVVAQSTTIEDALGQTHDHTGLSGDHAEHLAALDLVKPADATHIAINDGDWFNPNTWADGVVPGDGARVLIADGVVVTYAGESDARIFTIGVDGELRFDDQTNSKLIVDTLVVTPSGRLEIGTAVNPVGPNVDINIVIANNGQIDTTWDAQLLSRGIVSLGEVELHGAEIDSHLKVITDPMAGDTSITLTEEPLGWQVGDTITIAGTHNPGWTDFRYPATYRGNQNETRTITEIDGNTVTFDQALVYDHDAPRSDLKTSVANYSRSITISSEDGAASAVHERGHVMFMGSDDVDVRFAAFEELGRTDKSFRSVPASSFEADQILFDSNVQGRYSLHLHKLGIEDRDNPIIIEGNAVVGSPGWGIAQHSSNANLHNNATQDIFGASYVSEAGDETGVWSDNISLGNTGVLHIERDHRDVAAGDLARSGSGFWHQSRMIDTYDNIAAATRTGFVWIAQGSTEEVEASFLDQPESIGFGETVSSRDQAISLARNNEVISSELGLTVTKGHPNQEHDIRSMIDGFTAWNVRDGVKAIYTAHYTFKDFDLIANDGSDNNAKPDEAFIFANNASDMVLIDPRISGFKHAYNFTDFFTPGLNATQADKQFFVVGGDVTNIGSSVFKQDDYLDRTTLIDPDDIVLRTPTVNLIIPDLETDGRNVQNLSGSRLDSLGTGPIGLGSDEVSYERNDIRALIRAEGYWEKDGRFGVIKEFLFQDRFTGEIIKEGHFIPFVDNALANTSYYNVGEFNGVLPETNLAPVAQVDDAATQFRTPVTFNLIANDTDPDGNAIRVDGFVQPFYGRVRDNGDGTVTYTPDLGFHGTDTFEYWVTDGVGGYTKSSATVVVDAPASSQVITGTSNSDTLTGTVGDDIVDALGADDLILLQDGGSDIVNSGAGNDGVFFGAAFDPTDAVDGDEGDADQIALQGDYSAGTTFGALSTVNVEQVILLPGSNTAFGAPGTEFYDYDLTLVDANIGANEFLIFQANQLQAGEDFSLEASAETDGSIFTFAGLGNESITGGGSNDAFFFGMGRFNPGDRVDGGTGGQDSVGLQGDFATQLTIGPNQLVNIDLLVLLSSTDARFGVGSNSLFSYDITMDDGNVASGQSMTINANTLIAGETFTFDGSAETDGFFLIFSGDGNDTISGSEGGDTIFGRGGADTLTGNSGDDVFLYTDVSESTPSAVDLITDFTTGDRVGLSDIDANTGVAGDQAFSFIGSAAFTAAGQLRAVNTSSNDWTIQADDDGDGIADLQISVTTSDGSLWDVSDFVL